jgi:hypothetical protein
MSHHFDTPTGREDPWLNFGDLYLFEGSSEARTVMAMTSNPGVAPGAARAFRDDGRYEFRFDTNGDGVEDVSFKVSFGESAGVQSFSVRRATGQDAISGSAGDLLAEGVTSEVAKGSQGTLAFTGIAWDVFAGDGTALEAYEAHFATGTCAPEHFQNRANLFAGRRIAVIVMEVPTELIGTGQVNAWGTISLHGHAPEIQVARWGLPLLTHLFIRENQMREDFNRTAPSGNNTPFIERIAEVIRETVHRAGTVSNPEAYAERVLARLGSLTLPYKLGSTAAFDYMGFNGRALEDDVMDVMLSLMTNSALGDGVAPDPALIRDAFPYFHAAIVTGTLLPVGSLQVFNAGIAHQMERYSDSVRMPARSDQLFVSGTPGLAPDATLADIAAIPQEGRRAGKGWMLCGQHRVH